MSNKKGVSIAGVIFAVDDKPVDLDQFVDDFIAWIESQGLECCATYRAIDDEWSVTK